MSNNRVLLYSINYAPELSGIGKYNAEMAEWLAEQGFEVKVVTGYPYYPEWKLGHGYGGKWYSKEKLNGVKVWRCPIWVPKQVTGLKRLFHLASFAATSLPILFAQMFRKPGLMIVIEPPLAVSPAALMASKLFSVRSWLHVQDLEVDAAFELGILPRNKLLRRIVLAFEKGLMKGYDVVSTISGTMLDRIHGKGIPKNKIKMLPNWVDTSAVFPIGSYVGGYREELGIEKDDFVVLYSGNMGEKQGLAVLVEAAAMLTDDAKLKFIVCGDGTDRKNLVDQSQKRGVYGKNVFFLPLQPTERFNELMNTADAHALIQKKGASDLVMPSKLTGMFASGRPVVATCEEDTMISRVVNASGTGVVVSPENAELLAKALLALSRDPAACSSYGNNARSYAVSHLSKQSIMERWFHDLEILTTEDKKEWKGSVRMHER
ncbi:WcaI family glycosyltransferase [Cohnella sp. GCM10027633]|uniref:WcaI family glycosyltransferase n=1 Tax=unclassified Cohnella TaxID=2636738 RepID=UPI003645B740